MSYDYPEGFEREVVDVKLPPEQEALIHAQEGADELYYRLSAIPGQADAAAAAADVASEYLEAWAYWKPKEPA